VNTTPPAVVLAAGTNGLGAVRSLHRAGIPAMVASRTREEIALRSRLPTSRLIANDESDEALLAAILRAPLGAVLIPTSDRFVDFLEQHASSLSPRYKWCRLPGDLADLLIDKASETAAIARHGIPLPRTISPLPDTPEELVAALGEAIIIKPRSWRFSQSLGRKNLTTNTLAALRERYPTLVPVRSDLVAQELVPGADQELWVCNCCFDRDHKLIGAFSFQRLGTSPAHVGVTTFALSVRNARVIEACETIGRALGYVGPAMIEFKRDPRTDQYLYLETNPRIGMCNWFDTVSGVNNVAMSYHVALGTAAIPVVPPQTEAWCYLDRLDDSYARRRDGESWPMILRHWRKRRGFRVVGPYFAWHDPMPAVVAVAGRLLGVVRAAARKLGFRS